MTEQKPQLMKNLFGEDYSDIPKKKHGTGGQKADDI